MPELTFSVNENIAGHATRFVATEEGEDVRRHPRRQGERGITNSQGGGRRPLVHICGSDSIPLPFWNMVGSRHNVQEILREPIELTQTKVFDADWEDIADVLTKAPKVCLMTCIQ